MTQSPFYEQTQAMFNAINTLQLDDLRTLVADEYGIVDIDPEGKTVVINSVDEWETYMAENFAAMQDANAALSTEVKSYHGEVMGDMGYSVVRFIQTVDLHVRTLHSHCVATIVWKYTDGQWKEARWHCSLEKLDVETDGIAAAD